MSGSWQSSDLPHLNSTNHQVTSPRKNRYNCIAWAAGCDDRWWWPANNYYWPQGVPRQVTLDAFAAAFETLGYERCASSSAQAGYEKVAIYAKSDNGVLVPTHAARQLPDGSWTSKLGALEDIEHHQPDDVNGPIYGRVALFLRRPIPN